MVRPRIGWRHCQWLQAQLGIEVCHISFPLPLCSRQTEIVDRARALRTYPAVFHESLLLGIWRRSRAAFWKKAATRAYKRHSQSVDDADLLDIVLHHIEMWDVQENVVRENERCVVCDQKIRGVVCHDIFWQTVHFGCRSRAGWLGCMPLKHSWHGRLLVWSIEHYGAATLRRTSRHFQCQAKVVNISLIDK